MYLIMATVFVYIYLIAYYISNSLLSLSLSYCKRWTRQVYPWQLFCSLFFQSAAATLASLLSPHICIGEPLEIVERKFEIIMIEKKATPASPLSRYWGLGSLKNWENRDSREKDYNDSKEKMIIERKMKWLKRRPPLPFSLHTKNWVNRDSATKLLVILGDFWAQEPRLHISSHIPLSGSIKSLKYVLTDHVESHLICLLSSNIMFLWRCFSCPSRSFFPLDSYDDASKSHQIFF